MFVRMTEKRLIKKIEMEGLSERGKAVLRQEAYSRHQKNFGSAVLLLLIFGGFGAHRFYLDKTWSSSRKTGAHLPSLSWARPSQFPFLCRGAV